MRTTVDLINLSLSYILDSNVLEKIWIEKLVSYKNQFLMIILEYLDVGPLFIFLKIRKLDSKSKECIFLGYGYKQFGYSL